MKSRIAAGVTLACFLVAPIGILVNHRNSDGAKVAQAQAVTSRDQDVLLIGDSWTAGGAFDEPVRAALARHGIVAIIHSIGYPGERSGKIYEHFAGLPETAHVCVVIAGVNDAQGHFGPDYYAHHIRLLASLALKRGCHPMMVALPRFDQVQAQTQLAFYLQLRNRLYQAIFDHGNAVTIDAYREQAGLELSDLSVKFMNPDPAIGSPSTQPALWANPAHLSPEGRLALSEAIGTEIASMEDTHPAP
jgi:hypothetical protein